ncbi:MAG TPA: DUF2125 domain-containing protein [Pseudolabrys sp.]|nr:DUF2125 domain-containing protein [Pseudolabrys sp.]
MTRYAPGFQPRRRTGRRYVVMVILVFALFGGWSWFWHYASVTAQATIDGWRAREAKVGRVYSCGSQTIGGYPFRIEVNCDRASAVLNRNKPPLEIKTPGVLIAAQIYQPTLLISEFTGPLTIAEPGYPPEFIANWTLAQTSVRGTPAAPQRVSIVFDRPVLDRMNGAVRENLLRANHIEIHGRMAEGSAVNKPVIEVALSLDDASAPALSPVSVQPVDADIVAVLRGLNDFSPKPWPVRFREIQAAGGRIDITKARVQQGETIALGSGALSINANGRLQGQLNVTVAGLEPFLKTIGADRLVQASPTVDRLAGSLDKLIPGLGSVARQQAGANVAAGINLLGQPATLEGQRAVTLPLRFDNGAIFLGPIPIGQSPALF